MVPCEYNKDQDNSLNTLNDKDILFCIDITCVGFTLYGVICV